MTNEAGLEFERDEETTTINTVKTGDYDVVPSVFHYREKEIPQKLGCAADYDDTCYTCHAKGLWCERAEEMKKKIPTPMTIEMENDTFKNSENIKVSTEHVDKVKVSDGYVLVPKEPTGPMIMYGIHAHEKNDDLPDIGLGPKCVGIYKAMIGGFKYD